MFSVFGGFGQALVNAFEGKTSNPGQNQGFLHSRWSPVTPLTDDDYKKMLEEKLLRVEADIAIIDDHIKTLRESDQQQETSSPADTDSRSS
jgi:hypothetical protein